MQNHIATLDSGTKQNIIVVNALRNSVKLCPDGFRQLQNRLANLHIEARRYRRIASQCINSHCAEVYNDLAAQIDEGIAYKG